MDVIGVDVGGTKIAAGLVSAAGVVRASRWVATPGEAGGVLDVVAGLVAELAAGQRVSAVGVGARGVVDFGTGVVRSASGVIAGWAGTAVRAELARRTGLPVVVDNDVRAFALGEARFGVGAGIADALYVSVGTGVGGALVRGGEVVRGGRGTAGEIGHLLSPVSGPVACGCGRYDHLESVACGAAVDVLGPATAATLLGRVLSGLVTVLDTDAVIIGGGVAAGHGPAFRTPLATALHAEIRPPDRPLPVLAATTTPVHGPAALALAR